MGGGGDVPWEDPSLPFTSRLWLTIKGVVASPVQFFSNLPSDPGIGQPLLYGLIIYMIPAVLGTVLNMFLQGAALMSGIASQSGGETMGMGAMMLIMLVVVIVVLPVFCLIALFLGAGISHLLLMIVGDGQGGFPTTFRIICYGATPQLFGFIPCIGAFAGIWALVLYVLGAIHAHNTEAWRAVVALVVIPLICLACCIFGMVWTASDWVQGMSQAAGQ
jgi:hypothetical protein